MSPRDEIDVAEREAPEVLGAGFDETDMTDPGHRRADGPRMKRRRQQRRARLRRQVFGMGLATLLVVVAVLAGSRIVERMRHRGGRPGTGTPAAEAPRQETWMVIGTVEADRSGDAGWLSLASWNVRQDRGFLMYIPRSTLTEIPGHGQDTLARSLGLGREPLLVTTASNLLGVSFDHYLRVSDQGIRALFDKAGGVTLDIQQRLTANEADGRARVVFAEGRQHLDGARVAEYLGFIDPNGDEISRAVRHASVWSAFWEQYRTGGGGKKLGELFASSRDLFSTDASSAQLERFFGHFASVPAADIQLETMPVTSTGIQSGAQIYAPDSQGVEAMVDRYLAESRPRGAGRVGRRVEILNGNGSPGIGQQVSDLLIPKGFRVVLNQNARSFDYDTTQIVVYTGSAQALATGEEVKRVLGVGELVVSRQQQGIVDLTIVVGKDFLEAKR